jgi:hypothetical protein
MHVSVIFLSFFLVEENNTLLGLTKYKKPYDGMFRYWSAVQA